MKRIMVLYRPKWKGEAGENHEKKEYLGQFLQFITDDTIGLLMEPNEVMEEKHFTTCKLG